MRVRLYFDPLEIDVPDQDLGDFYDEGILADVDNMINYINENWDTLVDPSLPTLGAVVEVVTPQVFGARTKALSKQKENA